MKPDNFLLVGGLCFLIFPWLANPLYRGGLVGGRGRVEENPILAKAASSAIGAALLLLWYSLRK